MTQRSEHGGGELAAKFTALECEQEEQETAERRIASFHKSDAYLTNLALQEIEIISN